MCFVLNMVLGKGITHVLEHGLHLIDAGPVVCYSKFFFFLIPTHPSPGSTLYLQACGSSDP